MKNLLKWRETSLKRSASAMIAAASAAGFLAIATVAHSAPEHGVSSKKKSVHAHHAHRSVGKVAAPFEFVTPARYKVEQGEIATVSVDVRMLSNVDSFSATVHGEKGVSIVRAPKVSAAPRTNLEAGEVVSMSFEVSVAKEGQHYVNVIAQSKTGEHKRMSSYSVPLEVGDLKRAARAAKASEKAGQRIIDEKGVAMRVYPSAEATRLDEQIR